MQTKQLNKNLHEIFQSDYLVPLYQRNYSWGQDEILQLLQDLYDSYKKSKESSIDTLINTNYFIGSLVVLKRRDGRYEVIDGQQRLTTLSLLLRLLGLVQEPRLFYESRPEVESFLRSFYRDGVSNDMLIDPKVSHLANAVGLLQRSTVNPDEQENKTIEQLANEDDFKRYIYKHVILVRVEIPEDTDVASYFEIMNNRGEQLQKHEILKSYLMDKLKDDQGRYNKAQQKQFSQMWDACSQMDRYVQRGFSPELREIFFGEDYQSFCEEEINISRDENNANEVEFTIDDVLLGMVNVDSVEESKEDDGNLDAESIIDFPNFLMHVFKLRYSSYKDGTTISEIPLNEKFLLKVYDGLDTAIDDPMDFVKDLLFYRVVFDRYIIRTKNDENEEDAYKWMLWVPYRYDYITDGKSRTSLKYKSNFDHDERILKALSMLQVSFRSRKYKNWLFDILSYFSSKRVVDVSLSAYRSLLDNMILRYFESRVTEENYDTGVNVPHFLFNFIDYLYWIDGESETDKPKFNFQFKYRNSVEHHLAQSYRKDGSKPDYLDNLGNLCLVTKRSNSRMNNEDPVGKANNATGKYYKENLPPKQKEMYDLTNRSSKWQLEEIYRHRQEVMNLLERRRELLEVRELIM